MRKIRLDTLEKNQLDARAMNAVKAAIYVAVLVHMKAKAVLIQKIIRMPILPKIK